MVTLDDAALGVMSALVESASVKRTTEHDFVSNLMPLPFVARNIRLDLWFARKGAQTAENPE